MSEKHRIQRVGFIGGGTMGCYNALLASLAGCETIIYDPDTNALANAPPTQLAIAAHLVSSGFCKQQEVDKAIARIRLTDDLHEAIAGVDMVSESVTERLPVKREVHAQLEAMVSVDTLLTTNTSSLLVSDIEGCLDHGERFAALHSHLGSLLFDIVPGPRTSAATISSLTDYVERLNAEPLILKKEYPGYVFNALLGAVLLAAQTIYIRGIASIEEIDHAWTSLTGAEFGPFRLMDIFGLDVIADSWSKAQQQSVRRQWQAPVLKLLSERIEAGKLGIKSGAGFYNYAEPLPTPAAPAHTLDNSLLAQLMIGALINTAREIEKAGVVNRADIDRAWRVALSVANGPFDWLDQSGEAVFKHEYLPLLRDHQLLAGAA